MTPKKKHFIRPFHFTNHSCFEKVNCAYVFPKVSEFSKHNKAANRGYWIYF